MEDWRQVVGHRIRELRQQKRLSQERLALDSEIDLTYLGGIERGRRNPTLLVMARIAQALDVPLASLFTETADPS
jgi:transcriptional regulator with XRE-family HTH domain